MPGESDAVVVVHDSVPSRLRLRVAALRDRPARARQVAAALAGTEGIQAAEARSLTGSLVLTIDSRQPRDLILEAVRRALAAKAEAPRGAASAPTPIARAGSEPATAWHRLAVGEAIERLGSDAENGLCEAEAKKRLQRCGPNVLPAESPPSALHILVSQFTGLPIMLLAGSAVVSLATGGVADAVATLAIVVVNGILGFVTEGEAERTIRTLVDTAGQNVRVVRDGSERSLPARELVPGDLVLVRAGTQIAADARIVKIGRAHV